jgi:hypothetical protein
MTGSRTRRTVADMSTRAITVTVAALAIGALAWIDPLFVPLVLLGPLVSGVVAGAYGVDSRTVALVWFLGCLLMLASDLIVNNEDVAFHAVLAVFTAAVSGGAAWVGRRIRSARSPEPSSVV